MKGLKDNEDVTEGTESAKNLIVENNLIINKALQQREKIHLRITLDVLLRRTQAQVKMVTKEVKQEKKEGIPFFCLFFHTFQHAYEGNLLVEAFLTGMQSVWEQTLVEMVETPQNYLCHMVLKSLSDHEIYCWVPKITHTGNEHFIIKRYQDIFQVNVSEVRITSKDFTQTQK